jgi:crotonobetainyl-CoA:carnitine CoA-transferase CaiB-like acyl-CoA transferase
MNGEPLADIGAEPAYGVFQCADGKLLSLSIAHEDWFWRPLCNLLGMTDVADLGRTARTAREKELALRIGSALAQDTRETWGARFDTAGIPWGPLNTLREVADDPHFIARGLFRQLDDSSGSGRRYVTQPLLFDTEHPGPTRGVPSLGEHTDEILSALPRRSSP